MANSINTFLYPTDQSGIFGCGQNSTSQFLVVGEKTQLFQIPISGIADFSCGANHSVYLTENGKLVSAGTNSDGQCGQGSFSSPVSSGFMLTGVVPFTNAIQISAGKAHTVVLDTTGNVYGCGHGPSGALDLGGSPTSKSSLTAMWTSTPKITKVLASENFTIARRTDGKGLCVGENSHGQLGIGNTTNQTSWYFLGGGGGITGINDIGIGKDFSFIIKSDGNAWGAGRNSDGQLGINSVISPKTSFTQVSGITNVAKVVGGRTHSLFLLDDGTVWSCGSNSEGQLGTDFGANQTTPILVSGLSNNIIDIAAGDNLSYALTDSGILYAWGNNDEGAIGQGTSFGNFGVPIIMISGIGFGKIELYSNAAQMMGVGIVYENISPILFVNGYDLQENNIDLSINGVGFQNNQIDFFVENKQSEKQMNFFVNGLTIFDNITDLFIFGIEIENDAIDLFINNIAITNEIGFFIEGKPSGNIPFFIQGYFYHNNDMDLYISGAFKSNNNLDIFEYGFDIATNDLTLFIENVVTWSAYINVVANNPIDNIPLFIYGSQSGVLVGQTTDLFNLFINNDESIPFIDFSTTAFVRTNSGIIVNDHSNTWISFVKVDHVSYNIFDIFIKGHISGSQPLGIDYSNSFDVFIQGFGDIFSSGFTPQTQLFYSFVKVNSGFIDNIPLFVSGFMFPSNNLNMFIFGISGSQNDNSDLFINGYNNIDDSFRLNIFGILGNQFDNFDLYLEVVNIGNISDNFNFYIHGF